MAQDDLTVANASGAAVRADVNSNLQALGTLMSGATAPSTTWPYMWWADTANDLLKQRNAANSAWITKGTLSAAYGGLPASSITYDPGSPNLLSATDAQAAIDELAQSVNTRAAGAWVEISRQTASSSAQIDFSSLTGYDSYKLEIINAVPATDDTVFTLRIGTPTIQTGTNYGSEGVTMRGSSAYTGGSGLSHAPISNILSLGSGGGVGSASGEGISGSVDFFGLDSSTVKKQWVFRTSCIDAGGNLRGCEGCGGWGVAADVITAIRVMTLDSGGVQRNIASGTFVLYGIKK
jgi:hypothetical protein